MASPERDRLAAALTRRAGTGDDVTKVADGIVALWRDIERELTPVVGVRGVAALHGRSLFLATREHAWLGGTSDTVSLAMDLESLHNVIRAQSPPDALGAGRRCSRAFTIC
jgi:hypothetical protein